MTVKHIEFNLHSDLLTHWVSVCSFRSKIFEFRHIFKKKIVSIFVILSFILLMKHGQDCWSTQVFYQHNATSKGNSLSGCKEGRELDCLVLLPGRASVALVAQTHHSGRWIFSNNYLIVLTDTQGTTVAGHCTRPSRTGLITLVALFLVNITLASGRARTRTTAHTHTHTHTYTHKGDRETKINSCSSHCSSMD